ncbi:MAG: response regulator [Rhodothermales bacterium]|nr:response regulator [Rhodothermales bacterium]
MPHSQSNQHHSPTEIDRKKKILIVDDSRVIRLKLAYVLQKVGYEVFEAENGLLGLQLTAREHPDLILLDLKMAGIDGFEFQRRIRASKSYAHIPIIFLTAMGSINISQIADALGRGVNDFVTKPFKVDKLLAKIDAILKHEVKPALKSPVP